MSHVHGVRSADGLGIGPEFFQRFELLANLGQPLVGRDGLRGGLGRLPPGITRLVELLELEVDVAQMLEDRGVGAGPPPLDVRFHLLRGLLDRLQSFLDLAPLEQDPAQAVEISEVVRVFLQGLADHRFGFLEVLALLGVEVAQVVVGPGIVRVALEEQLELGLALGIVAPVHVNDREVWRTAVTTSSLSAWRFSMSSKSLIASSLRPVLESRSARVSS